MFKKLASSILGLSLAGCAWANGFLVHVQGGISIANLGSTQNLWLIDNAFENQYVTSNSATSSPFIGIGAAYQWDQPQWAFNLGLTGYYEENTLSGVKYPFINGGSFSTLNYSVLDKSRALMLEPKLIYTRYSWQPYCMAGIGIAANQLDDYSETPSTPGEGASPGNPFGDETTTSFAYEAGLGVQHTLFSNPKGQSLAFALEYHYLYWGKMSLSTAVGQTTNQGPNFGALQTNLIDVNLIWQF